MLDGDMKHLDVDCWPQQSPICSKPLYRYSERCIIDLRRYSNLGQVFRPHFYTQTLSLSVAQTLLLVAASEFAQVFLRLAPFLTFCHLYVNLEEHVARRDRTFQPACRIPIMHLGHFGQAG